ncbi:uri1, prefoldin-like chaperone [Linnemannia hyalina]|uniref:Uri1, prefoldin-like chaperone n=1 Tax=Linnemannia hyalina TaxID=64524 RepID=A0A9P7Y3P6_9FUNG|nr:uri1, prefoldin-like chaperone [Linnemannia hyalina]
MDRSQEPDRAAETSELANYFSKFSAALTQLDEELARWKNYESDYQALKTTLLDLPKEISHPVMVPIGNLAFMPGKIIHTNEVLVMLGDNWFVDRSAVQAAEIVERRMELVQENIEKLKAQEDEIRNKSGMAPGLLGGQEYNEEGLPIVEITEPYFSDDEEEKAAKAKKTQGKRGSQKTAEEQARDKAMLDRIAELELQDEEEEQERRGDAGEGDKDADEKEEEKKKDTNVNTEEKKDTDVNTEEAATNVEIEGATGAKTEDAQILPGSQKTPEEQARDRAILDRIEEMEREDDERERRREAGEDVTSDEETESDEYEDVDDDGESEDEFRPKALDSDEEYEEEVWEHSGNEEDEEEEEVALVQGSSGGAAARKTKKGVHFAEHMSKTKRFDAMSAPSQVRSATTAPPGPHPTPLATAAATATAAVAKPKPKSPADLYNQMRAKQQSVRAAGSDQIVNMANLESTFANMTAAAGGSSGLGKAPVFETPSAEPEATSLKSALKPAPKKVSLFKQARAQTETPAVVEMEVEQEPVPAPAPKKMSRFAQSRAAAAAAGGGGAAAGTVQERTPAKPAVGGISDSVVERKAPTPSFKSAPGVFEVVERSVPVVVKDVVPPSPAPVPITGIKDMVENTFTKPVASSAAVEPTSGGRRKTSLFRQQQQRSSMEPEPAVPGRNVLLSDEPSKEEEVVSRPRATAPAVVSRSASSGVVVEREPPVVVKASAKSTKAKAKAEPAMRTIPAVESSKLKDTALLKGAVVERDTIEPVDEEELEEDMLMRQVVSEYQERRQAMIAQYGAFTRDDIEEIWEKQVVIPPGMIIPEAEVIGVYDEDQDDEDEEEDEEEEEEEVKPEVVDDRNVPPKKLSLFRASRLTGSLAKQAKE